MGKMTDNQFGIGVGRPSNELTARTRKSGMASDQHPARGATPDGRNDAWFKSGVIERSLNTDAPTYEWQLDVVTTECAYRTIPTTVESQARAAVALHRASPDVVSVKLLRRTVIVEEVV